MRATLLLLLVLLAGCTTPPPQVIRWAKPGATQQNFNTDRYACLQEARTPVSSGAAYGGVASSNSGVVESAGLFFACLAARGYHRDENGFAPPDGVAVPLY